jgi:hypothetical protein
MDEWVVFDDAAKGVKLTSKGKGLWCQLPGNEMVCVPLSQISAESQVQDVGDLGALIVTKWWSEQQRITIPGSNTTNPDNHLILTVDWSPGVGTGTFIPIKCRWCGLNQDIPTGSVLCIECKEDISRFCYHCSRDVFTTALHSHYRTSEDPT